MDAFAALRRTVALAAAMAALCAASSPSARADDVGCPEDQNVRGVILGDIATTGHPVPCERVYRVVRSVVTHDRSVRPGWRCRRVSRDRDAERWTCRRRSSAIDFFAIPRIPPAGR
jgi:hypothetical protein